MNTAWLGKRKDKKRETVSLQLSEKFAVLIPRELVGKIIEDSFFCDRGCCVEENNSSDVLTEGCRDAGEALSKDPDAEIEVSGREGKVDKLASPTLYITAGSTVIKNNKSVLPLPSQTGELKIELDLMLLRGKKDQPFIVKRESALPCLVAKESWADDDNPAELFSERSPKLV